MVVLVNVKVVFVLVDVQVFVFKRCPQRLFLLLRRNFVNVLVFVFQNSLFHTLVGLGQTQ